VLLCPQAWPSTSAAALSASVALNQCCCSVCKRPSPVLLGLQAPFTNAAVCKRPSPVLLSANALHEFLPQGPPLQAPFMCALHNCLPQASFMSAVHKCPLQAPSASRLSSSFVFPKPSMSTLQCTVVTTVLDKIGIFSCAKVAHVSDFSTTELRLQILGA